MHPLGEPSPEQSTNPADPEARQLTGERIERLYEQVAMITSEYAGRSNQVRLELISGEPVTIEYDDEQHYGETDEVAEYFYLISLPERPIGSGRQDMVILYKPDDPQADQRQAKLLAVSWITDYETHQRVQGKDLQDALQTAEGCIRYGIPVSYEAAKEAVTMEPMHSVATLEAIYIQNTIDNATQPLDLAAENPSDTAQHVRLRVIGVDRDNPLPIACVDRYSIEANGSLQTTVEIFFENGPNHDRPFCARVVGLYRKGYLLHSEVQFFDATDDSNGLHTDYTQTRLAPSGRKVVYNAIHAQLAPGNLFVSEA